MSTLLTARDLCKTYESRTLFRGVGLTLVENDRLGIIGPNGAGKSTLLKVLAGLIEADDGDITRRRGFKQVYVPQDDKFADDATPMSAVIEALQSPGMATPGHSRVADGLDPQTRASITLSKLGFTDFNQPIDTLSGGWRKRVSIGCALVHEPDVLLLDEPTNHLDYETILWLERFVQSARMAVAFITHDRRFLENVAKRIIEIAPAYPQGTFEVIGNYSEFLRRKDAFLEAQQAAQSALGNTVRRDTAWLLQGIQGRQTRNKTQVDASAERQVELADLKRRNAAPSRTTAIDFQSTERKTKKLLALHHVSKSMGSKSLFNSIDLTLTPGRRIGLLGPNGSGKTTLLRLMAGDLQPDSGSIKGAADLRIVTFSQHRGTLVSTQTLQEALCPIGDTVDYRGKPMHVTGWAKKFLFTPDQLSTFVGNLSGGEQARVLIANLMLEPADVLLLDEPTNDLDIPSLEVLEQALLEFPGAIVLVTHDRFMLERIATEYLALDGEGNGREFASIEQWQKHVSSREATSRPRPAKADSKRESQSRAEGASGSTANGKKKLSYKLQREADGMEEAILEAEARVAELQARAAEPGLTADHGGLTKVYAQLSEAQQHVQHLYDRWAELEALGS